MNKLFALVLDILLGILIAYCLIIGVVVALVGFAILFELFTTLLSHF
ncbi:MAG: hypothetical protein MI974_19075 [Chitinophagales bacterium]|nr:hypothetical protein [Chitinophagales bacterium]